MKSVAAEATNHPSSARSYEDLTWKTTRPRKPPRSNAVMSWAYLVNVSVTVPYIGDGTRSASSGR